MNQNIQLITIQKLQKTVQNTVAESILITDINTHKHCFPLLNCTLPKEQILTLDSGESAKNIDSVQKIWHFLLQNTVQKTTCIFILGGGILCDTAAFALSTFKRGIPFNLIPTTLLAMCDASIGGKTCVNFGHYKNMIGTFALPKAVFICKDFLQTLPHKQLLNGYAEMLKHGLIADSDYLEKLLNISNLNYLSEDTLLSKSIEIKQQIVSIDAYEKNERKLLNFGHTIAHAIEAVAQKNNILIEHGEAVAAGILMELYLSYKKFPQPVNPYKKVQEKIREIFPHQIWIKQYVKDIYIATLQDKKNENDRQLFTLLKEPGVGIINQIINEKEILESLEWYN